ncbi:MAG: alpha-ketoglutarate-dependent dioxygenase AlkB [Actinomycetota bacterium]|nr:alpha-ketoglutarate-dependent dioxygenase AlkB [Actinomycetota bacterium]
MAVHQLTLPGGGDPALHDTAPFERTALDDQSWVDVARGWMAGADSLLALFEATVEWKQGKRWMYERMVDDPRLSRWFPAGTTPPDPVLAAAKHALEQRYCVRLGSIGLNYYRDGSDSVAWHADKELRDVDDSLVAILTLGGPRPLLIRPKGKGRSRDFGPGSGDLLVMGGRCQVDWEHSVPKVRRAGPRMSCSWRWSRAVEKVRRAADRSAAKT